jgi:hypothetical protein
MDIALRYFPRALFGFLSVYLIYAVGTRQAPWFADALAGQPDWVIYTIIAILLIVEIAVCWPVLVTKRHE